MITLRKIAETATTLTLGWDAIPNAEYYLFYAADKRVSNAPAVDSSGNPKTSIKFSKGAEPYEVVAVLRSGSNVMSVETGVYTTTTPPNAVVTQSLPAGDFVGRVPWTATYDANGDGSPDDPGSVRFLVDGAVVNTEQDPPFGDAAGFWDSTSVPNGSHSFQVQAVRPDSTIAAASTVRTANILNGSPTPGYGAKLPPKPSSLGASLQVVNVPIAGSGDIFLSGQDKWFKFPAGGLIQGRDVVIGNGMRNCRIDFNGCASRGAANWIRGQGHNANLSDLVIENFDADQFGNQGLIGFGPAIRIWVINGKVRGGGTFPMVTHPERHGMYLGDGPSGFWRECVIGNVLFKDLINGYGLQAYSGYAGGGGLVDSVITGCTFDNIGAGSYPPTVPGTGRSTDDVGICVIVSGQSERVKIANCFALNSRRQLAAAGAGAKTPALEIITSAEVGRKGLWGGGQPGGVIGSPGNDPNITGDPGYRLPWDPRTTGVGAF